MGATFDPYYKWLGIPPRDQPPTHYRLLAIEQFEPDREVIDAAANRLMAYLKSLSTGDDATVAQRVLNEVAAARRCLLDPRSKAEYDQKLRGGPSAPDRAAAERPAGDRPTPARPQPAPVAAPPAAEPSVSVTRRTVYQPRQGSGKTFAAELPVSAASAARKRREEKLKRTPWQQRPEVWMTAAGALTVALIVFIVMAVSSANRTATQEVAATSPLRAPPDPAVRHKFVPKDNAAPSRPLPDADRKPDTALARPAASDSEPAEPSVREADVPNDSSSLAAAKTSAAAVDDRVTDMPVATAPIQAPASSARAAISAPVISSSAATPPADPLAGFGAALPLPPYPQEAGGTASGMAVLGPLPVANPADVQFTLLGAEEVFGHSSHVSLAAAEGTPDHWRVELRERDEAARPIAEFLIKGGTLQFAWATDPPCPHADLLRNCLLKIAVGAHEVSLPLRAPQAAELLTILSDKGTQSHVINVPGVAAGLRYELEVTGVTGPAPYKSAYKPALACGPGKSINLQWGDGAGAVYAQVAFEQVRPNGFTVLTRLLAQPPNAKYPKADKVFSSKAAAPIIKKLAAMTASHPRNNPALQGKPAELKKAVLDYETQYPQQKQNLETLAYLQRLESISADAGLRDAIRVHIGIFATVDGQRVEFVRGDRESAGAK